MRLSAWLLLFCNFVACDAEPVPLQESAAQAWPVLGEAQAQEVTLFGASDAPVRRILGTAEIEKVEKGKGGRSVAFKLWFQGDVQGYFKPEQTFASNWYSELASFYLDRELGLGRVPPAVGRRIEWKILRNRATSDSRIREVVVRDGFVRGSVVFWIPEPPLPVALPSGWESWLRIESTSSPSPFQRPKDYFKELRSGARRAIPTREDPGIGERSLELSDLILFDYLIGNIDRWGGSFTNVRTLGKDRPLIYLDNANGFELRSEPSRILEARLTFVQRFRRRTVEAIRRLDLERLERRMSSDPLAPLLSEAQLDALDARRRRIVEHVADTNRLYGSRVLSR